MVKTRVHDLAAEFGVAPEQLLNMLKDMNIFVRSHMSALENDQVAAVRVRWEREKRKTAEDAAPKKGRRKAEPDPWRRSKPKKRAAPRRSREVEARFRREGRGVAALELERPVLPEQEAWDRPEPRRACPRPVKELPRAAEAEEGEVATEGRGGKRRRYRSAFPAHSTTGRRRAPFIPRAATAGACARVQAVFSSRAPATRHARVGALPTGMPSRPAETAMLRGRTSG